MLYMIGLFIIAILIFALSTYLDKDNIKEQFNKKNKLLALVNVNVKGKIKKYINEEELKAIVLDETNKKIHLFISENVHLPFDFNDIIRSEILIDNETIISTNKGSQIAGSIVGGIIAGVPGMIIGGLSGEQTAKGNIKNIELKLTLNNMSNPTFKISFLSHISKVGHSKDSSKIKNAINEIEKWQGYFDIILKQQNNVISS